MENNINNNEWQDNEEVIIELMKGPAKRWNAEAIMNILFDDSSSSSSGSEMNSADPNLIEIIDLYSDAVFENHFGLKRNIAKSIIAKYSDYVCVQEKNKLQSVEKINNNCKTDFYIYLWYISSTICYDQLAADFQFEKEICRQRVRHVTSWLITTSHEYIKWPNNIEQVKFQGIFGLAGAIGAIDCSYFPIKAPSSDLKSYCDENKQFSIVVQAIVAANQKFIDLHIGEPGSLQPFRVLQRSPIYERLSQSHNEYLPDNTYLLGQQAYASCQQKWIVTPFENNGHLTEQQKKFNIRHSQRRNVVQHTFEGLKNKFKRLTELQEEANICAAVNLIAGICVIHNLCIILQENDVT